MSYLFHYIRARCTSRRLLACAALVAGAATHTSAAVTWHDVQFGGFFSQGYAVNSGDNDYIGDSSEGTVDFREYAVNASYAIGKWRVGAQVFGQKFGEYGDDKIKLDWANVDYQAAQWFGVRAGRVKMPRGLYNEALDLDSVRPFVLLPQSVYDARLRDFNAAINGGMIYGNIGLKRAGSVDYRVFYGEIPMSVESGANDYFNNDAPFSNVEIGMDHAYGGTLFWNTPINGLRTGYSYSAFIDFSSDRLVTIITGSPIFYKSTPLYARHLLSVEYITGDWIFAAEAGLEQASYDIGRKGFARQFQKDVQSTYGYLSIARRINSRFEVGTYVSTSRDTDAGDPLALPVLEQTDYALSLRFDLNDNVILKLEGHQIEGAGKLFNLPSNPQPVAQRDESWQLVTAKVTLSF